MKTVNKTTRVKSAAKTNKKAKTTKKTAPKNKAIAAAPAVIELTAVEVKADGTETVLERIENEAPAAAPIAQDWKIDHRRGNQDTTVSDQWWSRPDDQRFTSLEELLLFVNTRKARTEDVLLNGKELGFKAGDHNQLLITYQDQILKPNHTAFAQLCAEMGARPDYIKRMPVDLASQVLQWSIKERPLESVKALTETRETGKGITCVNSATYGRLFDADLLNLMAKLIAGQGWKVPGMIDWSTGHYNPHVDVTKDTTSLFASICDFFVFLVKDTQPIECGKLPNGDPDLYFPGFYMWGSETGTKDTGVSKFMLRGVCQNRTLWGVEDQTTIKLRHSKNSFDTFHKRIVPVLDKISDEHPLDFVTQTTLAKARVVAKTDDERRAFVKRNTGFSEATTSAILRIVEEEEGHPLETLHDGIQGITAFARREPNQDKRTVIEEKASSLLRAAA